MRRNIFWEEELKRAFGTSMYKLKLLLAAIIAAMAITSAAMLPNIISLWNQYHTILAELRSEHGDVIKIPEAVYEEMIRDHSMFFAALSEYVGIMAGLFVACVIISLLIVTGSHRIKPEW